METRKMFFSRRNLLKGSAASLAARFQYQNDKAEALSPRQI